MSHLGSRITQHTKDALSLPNKGAPYSNERADAVTKDELLKLAEAFSIAQVELDICVALRLARDIYESRSSALVDAQRLYREGLRAYLSTPEAER